MLLHSDLKLRRWDPNLTMMSGHSVSPIRSYDDALGGGRMLSMKPTYVLPNQLMNVNRNPYRSLYYLPQFQNNEEPIMYENNSIKTSIETAMKRYILQERENIKNELVEEALTDIRNELQYSHRKLA